MKNQLLVATMAIAFAANSFAADWRAIAEAAGPAWKATATGLEAKGPRYHDLPETALDGVGDVRFLAKASERDIFEHFSADSLGNGRRHRRLDHPGGDAVGADATPGGLAADHAHHGFHAGLGGRVIRLAVEPEYGGDARHAHNRSVIPHDLEGELGAMEDTGEVDPDHRVPFLERHLCDGPVT